MSGIIPRRILCLCLGFSFGIRLFAQAPLPSLRNGGFEEGPEGGLPPGWEYGPRNEGYAARVPGKAAREGRRGLRLEAVSPDPSRAWANTGILRQALDATPFRGKRIRVSGFIRLAPDGTRSGCARLVLEVLRPDASIAFLDDMARNPIRSEAWSSCERVLDVDPGAATLVIACAAQGTPYADFDGIRLEVLGEAPKRVLAPPSPLSAQGLRNLETFTRAFGYVRFFHPSDAVAAADWERLAADGVRRTEGAASPAELAERLEAFFAPLAPTLQILRPGQDPRPLAAPEGAIQVTRWLHRGVGLDGLPGNRYRSLRQEAPLSRIPPDWQPSRPLLLELGQGLRCALPTVLWKDALGTLPHAPKAPSPALPEPTTFGEGAEDRAVRLADVVLAWTVFQHFYPYSESIRGDWGSTLARSLAKTALDKDEAAFLTTLRELVADLQDGHGGVQSRRSSAFAPILIDQVEGKWAVTGAAPGSGIPLGSLVDSADGLPIADRMAQLEGGVSAATPGFHRLRLGMALVRGEKGTALKLGIQTPSGEKKAVDLIRGSQPWEAFQPKRPERISEPKPGCLYVNLDSVPEAEFQAALPRLAAAKAVIFDLRGYPQMSPAFLQHLSGNRLESAQWRVPLVTEPDRQHWAWETPNRWDLKPLKPRISGKLVFLTDASAISYAESCLGIVEAYKLAEIVGEPTAGTNGNINPFTLPGGFTINWTGMKVLKHDGSPHHGVGIRPTVPVRPTLKGLAEGRDEVLEKGLEVALH